MNVKLHGNINSAFVLGATAAIFAAQPVFAQVTQVTRVKLNPVDSGVNLVLEASSGERAQVFTTKRGNTLVADIINTQLRLPEGNNFRQDNPAPGIASVAINQLDANSVRVVVTGSNGTPGTQPVARSRDGLTLSFTPGDGTVAATPPTVPTAPLAPPAGISNAQTAPTTGPGQPSNVAPPFLPRAVAPPVGDIAISAIDASPSVIDLGTQERVPRLVLRDAPVREVLSLLARAANMNLAYSSVDPTAAGGGQPAASGPGEGLKVSLDIQNEPVQDVFNYVLRLSGLEANRSGRTIFVGPRLPNSSRDTVMRNLRLNQVTVDVALNFLVGLGAESAISRERQVTSVSAVPVGQGVATTQTQTTTETRVERLSLEDSKYSSPLLRGLQALGDQRTNSLTLIGTPKQVELAMAQLSQLDVRRRQAAVNVKIVDINLSGIKDFNTSFSFGIGNNYFVSDGGAASLNFGGSRPATSAEASGSLTSTPTIANPYAGSAPLLDANGTFTVPNGGSGLRVLQDGRVVTDIPGNATFLNPISPTTNSPTTPGLTDFTPGTPDTVTITTDPTTGRQTAAFAEGTRATSQFGLPSLYQFPKRFLASIQAQVQNRNAKILTDPTLIVQEGQQAQVNLTQEVVGNITERIVDTPGGSRTERTIDKQKVGLTLNVKVDRIDDNGFVSLSVAPAVSAPIASQNTGAGQIVLVSERSLTSGVIRLRDGQTLILSGIIQDQDRTTVSKLPILGDIPLLGSLFRRTNRENTRNEVIVLLTPQVLDDSERSSYGYNYNPSPEVRQMLERRGLQVPRK
ncbi:type II and III secretion system protein [Rivularia sp. IAM M-261]|nr:type II and III secretion system protein [Rivularia sp. IAM M-261]